MVDAEDHVKLIDFGIAGSEGIAAADVCQAHAGHGHAGLHFARAGEIEARRRAQRRLCAGSDALRDAHRRRAVPRAECLCHHERPAAEQSDSTARTESRDLAASCRRSSTAPWSAIPPTVMPAPRSLRTTCAIRSRSAWRNVPNCGTGRSGARPGSGKSCSTLFLAMIPVVIFGLLFYFARLNQHK